MKKKFILSSLLLLTGLFAVGCSNTDPEASTNDSSIENVSSVEQDVSSAEQNISSAKQDVSMNESQIADAITDGLDKEPYTSGEVTLLVAKCNVTTSGSEFPAGYAETVKQQYLSAYATQIGASSVEVGQPVKRTYNQEQCNSLRLGSNYLEAFTGQFDEKNYYQKADGNYVMELTTVQSAVNQGVSQNISVLDVVTFDERSYIVHEEVTTISIASTNGASVRIETLTINDVVYQ